MDSSPSQSRVKLVIIKGLNESLFWRGMDRRGDGSGAVPRPSAVIRVRTTKTTTPADLDALLSHPHHPSIQQPCARPRSSDYTASSQSVDPHVQSRLPHAPPRTMPIQCKLPQRLAVLTDNVHGLHRLFLLLLHAALVSAWSPCRQIDLCHATLAPILTTAMAVGAAVRQANACAANVARGSSTAKESRHVDDNARSC